MQTTRDGDKRRGHYLYAQPGERTVGNGTGRLGKTWGEVRGRNGVIIVAPSVHEKAQTGGLYTWQQTGPVPGLRAPSPSSYRTRAAPRRTPPPTVKSRPSSTSTRDRPGAGCCTL